MEPISIRFQKLSGVFTTNVKKVLWILARHAFLFVLIFALLTVIIGEFMFYSYIILPESKIVDPSSNMIKFQEEDYKSVIEEQKIRESIFKGSLKSQYQNPF